MTNSDQDDYLEFKVEKALATRGLSKNKEYVERAKEELAIIKDMGFSSYFLIVADFVEYAKKNGIPVGPGRGSGGGSVVAYLLGIIEVNPIKYGLIFSRFLNEGRRTSMALDVTGHKQKDFVDNMLSTFSSELILG